MEEITSVDVSYQPIELCKLLKIANMVGGGGEAKIVISEGYVYVNGEVEFQKRKKIYHQDIVEFNGEVIEVICSEPVLNPEEKKALKVAKAIKAEQSIKAKQEAQKEANKNKARAKTHKKPSNNKNKNQLNNPIKNQDEINEPASPFGKRKRISF